MPDAERERRGLKWGWIVLPSSLQFIAIALILGACTLSKVREGKFELGWGGAFLSVGVGLLAFFIGAISILIERRDLVEKCGGRRAVLLSAACLGAVTLMQLILCDLLSEPFFLE